MHVRQLPSVYHNRYFQLTDQNRITRLFERDPWHTVGGNGDFARLKLVETRPKNVEVYPLNVNLDLRNVQEYGVKIFPKMSRFAVTSAQPDKAGFSDEVAMINHYSDKNSSVLVELRDNIFCIFMPYYPNINYRELPELGKMAQVINFLSLYGRELLVLHGKQICFMDMQENNCLVSINIKKINFFKTKGFFKKKQRVAFECELSAKLIDFGQAGFVGTSFVGREKKVSEGKIAQAELPRSFEHDTRQFLRLAVDLIGSCLHGEGIEVLPSLQAYKALEEKIQESKAIADILYALNDVGSGIFFIEKPEDLAKVIGSDVDFAGNLISLIKKSDYIRQVCQIAVDCGFFNGEVLERLIPRYIDYEHRLNLETCENQTLAWCDWCFKKGELTKLLSIDFLALSDEKRVCLMAERDDNDDETVCVMSSHGKQSWGMFPVGPGNEQSDIDSKYERR